MEDYLQYNMVELETEDIQARREEWLEQRRKDNERWLEEERERWNSLPVRRLSQEERIQGTMEHPALAAAFAVKSFKMLFG